MSIFVPRPPGTATTPRALRAKKSTVTWFSRFEFDEDQDAPIASPYSDTLGSAILTQVGNEFSKVAGQMLTAGNDRARFETAGVVRRPGVGFFFRCDSLTQEPSAGFDSASKVTSPDYAVMTHGVKGNARSINNPTTGIMNLIETHTTPTEQVWARWFDGNENIIVLRSVGAFYLKGIGTEKYLVWVNPFGTTSPVFPTWGSFHSPFAAESSAEYLRVGQISAPWNTDYGIAHFRTAGAMNVNDTFTHPADFFCQFKVDTLPSSGLIEVRFRIQDEDPGAEDFMLLDIASNGDVRIRQMVNGTPSTSGTGAGLTAGQYMSVIFFGGRAITYNHNVPKLNVAATLYTTQTAGRVASLGTGGAISDFTVYPRKVTSI